MAEKLAGSPGGANTALLVPSARKPAPLLIGGEFESLPAHHFIKKFKLLLITFFLGEKNREKAGQIK